MLTQYCACSQTEPAYAKLVYTTELVLAVLDYIKSNFKLLVQKLALVGKSNSPVIADKKLRTETFLHFCYSLAYSGLTYVIHFRSP